MKLRRAQYVSLVVTAIGVVFQWVAILGLGHGGARLAFAIGGEVLVGVCLVGALAVLYIDSMNKNREAALVMRSGGLPVLDPEDHQS